MFGMSSKGKEALTQVVENLFDTIALNFLGNIPKLRNKKTLTIISRQDFGLPHLFIQAMGNRSPNSLEKDVLKSLLDSAHGYIESLKNKTASNITERIDGLAREANLRKEILKEEEVQAVLDEELGKAKSHMAAIAESESTKMRNLGSMVDITRVSADIGDSDPTVFFVVVKDQSTCKECIRLHLMPNGIPRLWKLSELKQGYHKRGEDNASAFGLHPHCRCVYDGNSPIITEKGIKSLKNINIGDRVLTHTGKFKKVINTFGKEGISTCEDLYRIEFVSPDGKIRKLRVTADHLMLTEKGWIRADSLIPGIHFLKYLFKECELCKNPFYHDIQKPNKRFCSKKCSQQFILPKLLLSSKGRKHSKEEIEKRTISINKTKNNKANRLGTRDIRLFTCEECSHNFYIKMAYLNKADRFVYRKTPKFCSKSCSSKNSSQKQWKSEDHRKNISDKNKISMIEQFLSGKRKPNMGAARKALYGLGRGGSKDQIKMFEIIKSAYPAAEPEYPIYKFFADIAIPDIKVVIEWDGGGHWIEVYKGLKTMDQKILEDRFRDEFMNSNGWHVLRYNDKSGFTKVLEDIRRVSLNSTSGYSFENVEIKNVIKVNKCKVSKLAKLYDISVEEDESFVIMGVVSHNCTLTYLSQGFGFDEFGKLKYKSQNFDAYSKQK